MPSGILLDKVCEYMCYNKKYRDAKDVPDMEYKTHSSITILQADAFIVSILKSASNCLSQPTT